MMASVAGRSVCNLLRTPIHKNILTSLYNARGYCSASPSQERLSKRLARSGVASRRAAEQLIEQGKVFVNGVKANLKNNMIVNESDVVTVFGKKIRKDHTKLWMHYKKPGILVTHKPDEAGRPALFPILKQIMNVDHIISVGRLDYNSEGLLLLTNNGELANRIENPKNEIPRVYKVRIRGVVTEDMLKQLGKGVVVDGVRYQPMKVTTEEREGTPANRWVTCTLSEGKNREIRRIFDHFNMPVSRIVRVKYGPGRYALTSLAPGDTKSVPVQWITKLLNWEPHPTKDYEREAQPKKSTKPEPTKPTSKEVKVTTSNIGDVFGAQEAKPTKQTEKTHKIEKTQKPNKGEKFGKPVKQEKAEKIEKVAKPEKVEKSKRVEKVEKTEKAEKTEKEEKAKKTDKPKQQTDQQKQVEQPKTTKQSSSKSINKAKK